jgi:hypothetical protein
MKQLPAIDTAVDTFAAWVTKCNSLITLANTEMVTANNSANGAITTGKGYVIGSFGSNTINCDTLSGGNTVASGNLAVTSNVNFSNTSAVIKFSNGLTLGANSIGYESTVRKTTSANTANQIVDTFATSAYRSAKYVISVTDPVNSKYQATEIMVVHDGTTTFTTEYATLLSNTSLATFTTDISAGSVRLLVTPTPANVQINVVKTLIST